MKQQNKKITLHALYHNFNKLFALVILDFLEIIWREKYSNFPPRKYQICKDGYGEKLVEIVD
jgi:hypothetical protein